MAARKMIQLRVAAGVFSCCAGLSHGLSSSVSVGGSTQLPVLLRGNPLKELSELPKTHFSWPFPAEFFDSDVSFLDGAMHDYVRITGSCALLLADTQHELNATSVAACVAICRAVAPQRAAVGKPPPVLSVQYSPWYRLFPGTDPRPAGAPEAAELKFFTAQLTALKAAAPETGAGSLGAVLIDSEKFKVQKNSTAEYNASLTRKHDLLWNATRAVFPGVRIVQYDRGTVRKSEAQSTWTPSQQYALDELGDSYSVSLYRLPEIWEMRGTMLHTVALAKARNVTSVIPWVSLSSGDRRVANRSMLSVFDYRWNYDRVYSWQIGAELNDPYFAMRPDQFAPWGYADVVCFYPSIFNGAGVRVGNASTSFMEHFVSYVRGANGLDGVGDCPEDAGPDASGGPDACVGDRQWG